MNDPQFCTATLARLYAKQGHLRKAVEIYRNLLQREPNGAELAAELEEIEEKLSRQGAPGDPELLPQFDQWLRMLLHYRRLQKLKNMGKQFSNG